jgi:hypothetical protein
VNSKASITDVNNAIAGAGFASASALTTLSSTVGGHTTDITTNQSSINGLQGKYGVTINNNGAVSGFQINSGASGASNFIVQADTFQLKTSSGTLTPFTVSGDTVTINGNISLPSPTLTGGNSTDGVVISSDGMKVISGGVVRVRIGKLTNW